MLDLRVRALSPQTSDHLPVRIDSRHEHCGGLTGGGLVEIDRLFDSVPAIIAPGAAEVVLPERRLVRRPGHHKSPAGTSVLMATEHHGRPRVQPIYRTFSNHEGTIGVYPLKPQP